MKLGYIKQAVRNRQQRAAGSNKSARADYIGAKTRYRRALPDYYKSIQGDCKGTNKGQLEALRREWQQAGRSLKDFNRLGTIKVRQILKGY